MKGRISGILFLFCLAAPIVALFFYSSHHKRQVRREVKHHLMAITDLDDLVLLKFTDQERHDQLEWKHSKEFKYKEQMYDVVKAITKNDTTYYWCWWDNKETQLNKKLDNLMASIMGSDPVSRDNQNRLAQFYKSLYCEKELNFEVHSFYQENLVQQEAHFTYRGLAFPPPVPPPDFA